MAMMVSTGPRARDFRKLDDSSAEGATSVVVEEEDDDDIPW